jgi:hypothetical protein
MHASVASASPHHDDTNAYKLRGDIWDSEIAAVVDAVLDSYEVHIELLSPSTVSNCGSALSTH